MKITKVSIKNLNSIRGEHTIDFQESFSKHGLFLLTGDTGAGKTTILDAISIALYGETPRLKKIHELEQLISIGAKESLAEVEFVVDKVIYKSKWSISVAKTGTVKASKRELSRYDGTDFEIITPKTKRGFNDEIESITNLNFDRFTKTVMLAQGSFDAFLQAKPQDKSDLLEKITGTEIYQKISQRVFQREKEEKEKLIKLSDKIDESKILKDEEVKEKTDSIKGSKKESEALLKDIKEIQDIIKIVENISKYEKDIEGFKKQQTDLNTQKENFKEDEKKLNNSLKAKDVYTQITQEKEFAKELKEKTTQVGKLQIEKKELSQKLQKIGKKVKISDTNLTIFKELEKSKLKSLDEAKELLVHQITKEKSLDKDSKELKEKNKNLTQSLENIKRESEEKSEKENSLLEIAKVSVGVEAEKKVLELSLKKLEVDFKKIDKEKLFKEQNRLQNRIKEIKEFKKLQEENSKQSKLLEELQKSVEPQSKILEKLQVEKENIHKDIERLDELKLSALSIANYEESRKTLKDKEECPLCGSCNHPFMIDKPKFDDSIATDLSNAKSALKIIDKTIKDAEATINTTNTQLEVAKSSLQMTESKLKSLSVGVDDKLEIIENELKELGITIENSTKVEAAYTKAVKELEKLRVQVQESKDKEVDLKSKILLLDNNISNNNRQSDSLKIEITKLENSVKELSCEITEIVAKIEKLLNSKTPEEFKKELDDESSKLNKEQTTLRKSKDSVNEKITINTTTIGNLKDSIAELNQKLQLQDDKISKLLTEKEFKDREEVISKYIADEKRIEELQRVKKSLETQTIEISTNLKSTKESLEVELKKELKSTKSTEELSQSEKELTQKRDEINRSLTVLQEQLKQNDKIKDEQEKILQEIESQKNILLPWEILNNLIGSAKGDRYQRFVQNLTLGHLLSLANKHLMHLADRYKLVKTNNDELDISIVDGYYLDVKRGVNTLSGGERFLVSLSLALGLSDLVNDKIKVDSLFLDEGFGTLDEESLTMAIEALEKLHSKGKLIGVISHVALLKDRIYAQIQLKKKSGGSSDVVIID